MEDRLGIKSDNLDMGGMSVTRIHGEVGILGLRLLVADLGVSVVVLVPFGSLGLGSICSRSETRSMFFGVYFFARFEGFRAPSLVTS